MDADANVNGRLSTVILPSKIGRSSPFLEHTFELPRKRYVLNIAEF